MNLGFLHTLRVSHDSPYEMDRFVKAFCDGRLFEEFMPGTDKRDKDGNLVRPSYRDVWDADAGDTDFFEGEWPWNVMHDVGIDSCNHNFVNRRSMNDVDIRFATHNDVPFPVIVRWAAAGYRLFGTIIMPTGDWHYVLDGDVCWQLETVWGMFQGEMSMDGVTNRSTLADNWLMRSYPLQHESLPALMGCPDDGRYYLLADWQQVPEKAVVSITGSKEG